MARIGMNGSVSSVKSVVSLLYHRSIFRLMGQAEHEVNQTKKSQDDGSQVYIFPSSGSEFEVVASPKSSVCQLLPQSRSPAEVQAKPTDGPTMGVHLPHFMQKCCNMIDKDGSPQSKFVASRRKDCIDPRC